MSKIHLTLVFLVLFGNERTLAAPGSEDLEFSSGDERVALLELFTSEGCSSCPPADLWLAELKSHSGVWSDFVPVAFHVDYWDYIGWEDRFAQEKFADRQRRYADEGGARSVYTPGVFYNGNEWVGWRAGETVMPQPQNVGNLTARLSGETIAVRFDPTNNYDGTLEVHVAILGMNLETKVRAGENQGRTLNHDFVALSISSASLNKIGTAYSATLPSLKIKSPGEQRSLAVWITNGRAQMPIQATGGYLR